MAALDTTCFHAIQAHLSEALFESMMADAEVESLQAQLDVYKMLVKLESI